MEVQHGNSQLIIKNIFIKSLGWGDLENLTNGNETRNNINW